MDRVKRGRMHKTRCVSCGHFAPNYDIINDLSLKGCRQLCSHCFNDEVAKENGRKFEHVKFAPVELTDSAGKIHLFHFQTSLFGAGIALEAFEIRDGDRAGYQFEISTDSEEDQLVLLGQLTDKIKRALSFKHLVDGELGPEIADHHVVRGTIDCDVELGHVPLLVIDGREITWEEFGRMVLVCEGWQFKLEILEPSAES